MQEHDGPLQWWMLSNVATGVATGSFLTLLLPTFITSVTGEPWRVGVVFAVLSLAAAVGPAVGGLVDRTGSHRLVYTLAIAAMAASYGLLALDALLLWYSPLFGLLLGAAWATQGTIGPALIVGAGTPAALTARRMTAFSIAYPVGVVLGAVLVAATIAVGLATTATFLVCAGVLLGFAVLTWATTGDITAALEPSRPGRSSAPNRARNGVPSAAFIALLVVVFISSLGSNGLVSQLATVMPAVYGFSDLATALLVGLAGLLNIATLLIAGRALARSTPLAVFITGTGLRGLGATAMALIGALTEPLLVVAAVAMLLTYQGIPIPRLAAPGLAAQLSPGSPTRANGYYFASSAIGAAVGCVAAGIAAVTDYHAVLWLASVAGLAASAIAVLWLIPAARETREDREARV